MRFRPAGIFFTFTLCRAVCDCRLRRLFADCGARVVLTSQKLKLALQATHAAGHRLPQSIVKWVVCKAGKAVPGAVLDGVDVMDKDPMETAFIQYTSGSSGDPKGVVVTYKALASNLASMCAGLVDNGVLPDSTCVTCT